MAKGICKYDNSYCAVCGSKHISKGDEIVSYGNGFGKWAAKTCYDEGVRRGEIGPNKVAKDHPELF